LRRLLAVVLLLVPLAVAVWLLIRDRPEPPPGPSWVNHESVLKAVQHGEIVRASEVFNVGTARGQFQTVEADPRDLTAATGMVSNPKGDPPYAWVVGRSATISLDVLQPQDRQLLVQVSNGTEGPQTVSVAFNGYPLITHGLSLDGRLQNLLTRVPGAIQKRGRNVVELSFENVQPRRLIGQLVELPLSGVVTNVRFVLPGRLEEEPEAPPPAGLVTLADGERQELLVPPGTSIRAPVRLPQAERVALRLDLATIGVPTELSVLLDGNVRERLRTFQPTEATPQVAWFDLTPWAGEPAIIEWWAREGQGPATRITAASILLPEPVGADEPADAVETIVADPAAPEGLARPSFLLVTLDAFARRELEAAERPHEVAPNLSALAEQGLVFEQALAPASYTLASVGTLLTGQGPETHGVVMVEGPEGVRRLDVGAPRLASRLAEQGWRTAAFVTNPNAAGRHGFEQGFERYDELFREPELWREGVAGEHLPPRLAGWLGEVGDEPFLAWVHVFEPHAPYDSPPDLRARFVAPYDGPVRGDRRWIDAYKTSEVAVDEAGWRHLRELYRARMALSDRVLGDLLAVLESTGRQDDTVVVVTSDHGEAFGQHGSIEHGDEVYGEQLEVPLVMVIPGEQPRRVAEPATLADIAPTLLSLAGLDVPPDVEGRDLRGMAAGASVPLLSRSSERRPVLAWTRGSSRLIVDTETRRRELYDLVEDPGESRNLIDSRPATAALLYRELCTAVCEAEETRLASRTTVATPEQDEQALRDQLAAIGYTATDEDPDMTDTLCHLLRTRLRRL
jgi:arylsulfatase A-like enzyme